MLKIFTIFYVSIILISCSSTGVVPADRGTYMISKQSAAGIFGTSGGIRTDVYSEANVFCQRTDKVVETVNLEIKDAIPFERTSSVMLQFKCVSL